MKLKRGTWYRVTWMDYQIGFENLEQADVSQREIRGEFIRWGKREVAGRRFKFAVFALIGEECDDRSQSAWIACPKGAFIAKESPI